jgi:hypothetical protein
MSATQLSSPEQESGAAERRSLATPARSQLREALRRRARSKACQRRS